MVAAGTMLVLRMPVLLLLAARTLGAAVMLAVADGRWFPSADEDMKIKLCDNVVAKVARNDRAARIVDDSRHYENTTGVRAAFCGWYSIGSLTAWWL
jgi:hypothetical protein